MDLFYFNSRRGSEAIQQGGIVDQNSPNRPIASSLLLYIPISQGPVTRNIVYTRVTSGYTPGVTLCNTTGVTPSYTPGVTLEVRYTLG